MGGNGGRWGTRWARFGSLSSSASSSDGAPAT
eukprot:CAMPEP_0183775130 /NCGR_PEP_ID=MMETSP0739-20130205/43685_1 /TAXON_ID=385413 /ORGANISM="Thalassiosira miniscula, Strain CCMP1093" /LENGTH=31 /DNA_ID= /DNA_START= /DNA_END= /DNA_ORIENTATION=